MGIIERKLGTLNVVRNKGVASVSVDNNDRKYYAAYIKGRELKVKRYPFYYRVRV